MTYPGSSLYPSSSTFPGSGGWAGGTGAIEVAGTSGSFSSASGATWAGTVATIRVTGVSGVFVQNLPGLYPSDTQYPSDGLYPGVPGAAFQGSQATIAVVGTSGVFAGDGTTPPTVSEEGLSYLLTSARGPILRANGGPVLVDRTVVPAVSVPTDPILTAVPYSIDVCVNWVKVGEVLGGSFDGVIRHLAVGEWTLEGFVDSVELQPDVRLEDVDTLRVVQGSVLLYGGYVTTIEIAESGDGDRFVMNGLDLWAPLAWMIAFPHPSMLPPWPDSHDIRFGAASTVAAGYIRDNAGTTAIEDRQYWPISIVDGDTGDAKEWSARLQPLNDLIARICTDGGITCRPRLGFDGSITYWLGHSEDRSASAVLSDKDALVGIRKVYTKAKATYVVAGGQGELTNRMFATARSTGGRRIEMFSDQASLTSPSELQAAAVAAVTVNADDLTVQAEITDRAAADFAYLNKYDVGDLVAVEIDFVRYPIPVTAVAFHISPERSVVRPTLGSASLNKLTGLLRDVADLQSRFDTQIA